MNKYDEPGASYLIDEEIKKDRERLLQEFAWMVVTEVASYEICPDHQMLAKRLVEMKRNNEK